MPGKGNIPNRAKAALAGALGGITVAAPEAVQNAAKGLQELLTGLMP